MKRLSRFERKILAAIAAVAFVPLVAALLFGRAALREAYAVGVNSRVRGQLERSLTMYRRHFLALRQSAELTADAVAGGWDMREGIRRNDSARMRASADYAFSRYPNLVRVVVGPDTSAELSFETPRTVHSSSVRLLTLERQVGKGAAAARVQVTVSAPLGPFVEYRRAGELVETFGRLQSGAGYVSGYFVGIYIGILFLVIAAAMAVGIVISRRVTRRVAVLAQATARVGAGDLTVQVPTDATDEIGELTRAFNDMVRDIQLSRERIQYLQRISAWQEFAKRLAHEIKNPLTPIQLAAQEAHRSYTGGDARFERVLNEMRTVIEEEVAVLRRLVGEFSAFAKLPEARLAPADLGDFVRESMSSVGSFGDGHPENALGDPRVRWEVESQPMPVLIDSMMLKRCLDNLVRNAVQALTATRGKEGQVVVSARADGRVAILEVNDDGPGVPAGERARVFDPYFTTKADGTGLGLAIVKKIVLEHRGEIECTASRQNGALFRIRLPLAGARPE